MNVMRTEDKNGQGNLIISGNTTAVAPGTAIVIKADGYTFNGGLVDGDGQFRRPLPDIPCRSVEVWTTDKFNPVLIDSWQEESAEEEEPVKKKITRKKVA